MKSPLTIPSHATVPAFLSGGGQMARYIREHDWNNTPLGRPDAWPQSLQSAVGICLHSPFAAAVFWGEEGRILYNDAWSEIIGAGHPSALGKSAAEAFSEWRAGTVPPFEKVFNGQSLRLNDVQLTATEQGPTEAQLYGLQLSPVYGEGGGVKGVLATATETAFQVPNAKRFRPAESEAAKTLPDKKPVLANPYHIFDEVPFAVALLTGEDLVIDFINQYNLDIWQRTREEVLGRPLFDVFPGNRAGAAPIHQEIYRTGKRFTAKELPIELTVDGRTETRWFNTVIDPLRNQQGQISGQLATTIEVTEQVKARQKIEDARNQLTSLANAMPQVVWIAESNGEVAYYNNRVQEFAGAQKLDDGNWSWEGMVHPDDLPATAAAWNKAVAEGGVYQKEHRIKMQDGQYRWHLSRGFAHRDENGNVLNWYGTATDIHDLKEAEEKLRYTAALTANIADAVIGTDTDYRITSWNRGAEELYGYTAEEALGKPGRALLQTEFANPDDAVAWEKALQTTGHWQGEVLHRRKDGVRIPVLSSAAVVRNEAGEVLGAVGVNRDISERKEIETALRHSKEQLELTFQNVPSAIYHFDKSGNILYLNEQGARQMGFASAEEMMAEKDLFRLRKRLDETFLVLDENGALLPVEKSSAAVSFRTGKPAEVVAQLVHKATGEAFWLLSKSAVLFDENGSISFVLTTSTDITPQKKSEQAIRKSEEEFRTISNAIPQLVWVCNSKGEVVYFNDQWYEFTGTGPEISLGHGWASLLHPDDVPGTLEKWNEAQQTATTLAVEYRLKTAAGTYRWVFSKGSPLMDGQGRIERWFGTCTDIHERKEIEQALRESETKFRSVVADAPAAIGLFVGRDLVIENPNQAFVDIVGKGWGIVGKPLREAMPELITEGQPYLQILDDVFTTGQTFKTAGSLVKIVQNGVLNSRYYNFTYSPLFDGDGKVWALLDIAIDVTDQVVAMQRVEASESRFRTLIEEAPVATCLFVGRELKIEIANEQIIAIMGKGPSVLGKPLAEAVPELRGQPFLQELDKVFATGETYENRNARADLLVNGEVKTSYFDYIFKPLKNADETVYAILDMTIDVTGHVLAKQEVQESEEKFRTLAEALPQMVWMRDFTGQVEYASGEWEDYSGIADIDEAWKAMVHPDDWAPVMAAWEKQYAAGRPFRHEVRLKNREGEYRWHYAVAEPIRDVGGKISKWIGALTDIHAQKTFSEKLEKEVAEQTKELQRSNEDLQQFAHVASHDLKEPVRKIRTFGSRLKDEFGAVLPEKARLYVEKMENAAERMYAMIEGVLLYSTLTGLEQAEEQTDLAQVMTDIENDLEVAIQQKMATVRFGQLPVIRGFPVLLYQLFYNLVYNSLKFAKAGVPPVVTVSSSFKRHPAAGRNALFAEIVVEDNGIGFAPAQADEIFKTFTRLNARDKYEGTGLGLALCKKIVERHGGTIKAEGREGDGAKFIVLLPVDKVQ